MTLISDIIPPDDQRKRVQPVPNHSARTFQRASERAKLTDHPQHQPVLSLDITTPQPKKMATIILEHQPAHHPIAPQPNLKPRSATKKPVATITKQSWQHRLLNLGEYPLIAAIALGSAYSPDIGQLLIGIFALLSLGLRIPSRYSFGTALLMLASVPFYQLLKQTGIAQNAAIYAYELLVLGTVLAIIELWRDVRRDKKRQPNP